MFRSLRRKSQALSLHMCEEILHNGSFGVLALHGDEGYPYAVPLNYVYCHGQIYFHGAKAGHRVDAIARNSKASFCVVGQDHIVPDAYTSHFRSVIVFGELHVLEEPEKREAIRILAQKYAPHHSTERREAAIESDYPPLCMTALTIRHISGKAAKELMGPESSARGNMPTDCTSKVV